MIDKKPFGIVLKVLPHKDQAYDTCGNWWFKDNKFQVRVSELGDWRKEFMIGVHELIEMALCKHRNITEEEVTDFDLEFEKRGGEGEPGADKHSPYRNEHFVAEIVERLLCSEFGIDWQEYDKEVSKLSQ